MMTKSLLDNVLGLNRKNKSANYVTLQDRAKRCVEEWEKDQQAAKGDEDHILGKNLEIPKDLSREDVVAELDARRLKSDSTEDTDD